MEEVMLFGKPATREQVESFRKNAWYDILVEECRDIKVERAWNIVNEILLCKMEIGQRITQDIKHFDKYGHGRGQALEGLSEDIGVSTREVYRMLSFYEQARTIADDGQKRLFVESNFSVSGLVNAFLDHYKIGKNTSWHSIYTKCLPSVGVEKKDELVDRGRDLIKCLWRHYSGFDPTWQKERCKGCLRLAKCGEIAELVEEQIIREDEEKVRIKGS